MAKSGPQRYPGASTTYWYGLKYPGSVMETNVIVWHSTEGTSLPSYGGGASAPNFTAKPDFKAKRLVWYQHYDFDVSSRALVNKAGGVQTNTLNVCQVEVVGTCDPATHKKWGSTPHLYMPELPDWAVRDLAAFAKWAHDQHGVPLSSGLTFKPYPSSYGANGVRMTSAQWNTFKGHCGHQHVPENDHGDPGSMPMAAILAAAKNGTTPPQEDDMPTVPEIVKGVAKTDGIFDVPARWRQDNPSNEQWQFESILAFIGDRALDAGEAVKVLSAKVDAMKPLELTDTQLSALAIKVAMAPGLADAIASKVADLLATRLAE